MFCLVCEMDSPLRETGPLQCVRVLLPFLTCFPSVSTEERHFNINSSSLQVSKVHSFLSTSEQTAKSNKSQGRNCMGLISPSFWPFPPLLRVKYVEGRIARLSVCAWWELLNYRWMFLIIPHIGASAPRPWKPHVPHRPGLCLCPADPTARLHTFLWGPLRGTETVLGWELVLAKRKETGNKIKSC